MQAGLTLVPGSEVEDRQYQLDVNSLSVSVASWERVRAVSDGRGRAGPTGSQGVGCDGSGGGHARVQNPALEWNTELLRCVRQNWSS